MYSLPIVKSGSVFLQWNIIDLDHHLWKWKLTINEAELITQGAGKTIWLFSLIEFAGSITNSAGCHFDGGESMELWIQCNEPPKNGAELHIEDIKQFEVSSTSIYIIVNVFVRTMVDSPYLSMTSRLSCLNCRQAQRIRL